ncbi:hypothetical protein LZ32DRAFT_611916 [Colletotrichum eremochloae]|nr:hypothetical protein LZ32DRAFT_611916 [Colletotrichum eremochloae]
MQIVAASCGVSPNEQQYHIRHTYNRERVRVSRLMIVGHILIYLLQSLSFPWD